MASSLLPLVIEPDALEETIDNNEIIVVDLSRAPVYKRNHIPSAIHFDYSQIVASKSPVMGLLPTEEILGNVLSSAGISTDSHIVAYDDEGGGKACRLLWTLDVCGHSQFSLLNGGLQAWVNENHRVSNELEEPSQSNYKVTYSDKHKADKAYILTKLSNPGTVLLDARSIREYDGSDKRAHRGGHIPGAVNLEWSKLIDQTNNLRLKSSDEIMAQLAALDITPDKEVITYCHSHHRSAHSYIALKHLGFNKIKGYPGSWSDWGNDPETPIE
ncbi:MAG: sulfurtransferase [Gammaproteobacteria bacterium]